MKRLKTGLSIRGDSYYCPLSFQLDTYWNCTNKCEHCYLRRLNRTWGEDLRPLDLKEFHKKIVNGMKNSNPKTSLGWAIKQKKTIRLGNKTDPYQPAEEEFEVTKQVIKLLLHYNFSFVIQTKFTELVNRDLEILKKKPDWVSVMPIITPGLERDWELFEHGTTTNPIERLKHCQTYMKNNINVGVNGEPFIPGYHTIQNFRDTMKVLKQYNIKSYNTYHLHFNDLVAKNFLRIGLDIEKIWYMNQDIQWKAILRKLINIAAEYDIILGCPDFVNSGGYQETVNTCCGLSVPNPCTFNVIQWKKLFIAGKTSKEIVEKTYDHIGSKEDALGIIEGTTKNFYTLKDIDLKEKI